MEVFGRCKVWFAMEGARVIEGLLCIGEGGLDLPNKNSQMVATFGSTKGQGRV